MLSLVRVLLGPYCSRGHERVVVEGDDTGIGAEAATALSLVLYELSTDAAKHGALAGGEGRVSVTCRQDGDAMTLVWDERGRPRANAPPDQRGRSLDMSKRVAWIQLGAELSCAWRLDGLTTTIIMPTAMLAR